MTVLCEDKRLTKTSIEIVQVNLGNRCNQRCLHCHIEASPEGDKNMDEKTALLVLEKLMEILPRTVEFTGGAPEMNPNLRTFIEKLSAEGIKTTVRTNLTVLDMPEYSDLIDFYRKHEVKIIASLPGYFKEATDRQRGTGVFEKSIKVLKRLNNAGYGTEGLELDLVYNPDGDYLPPPPDRLEDDYRHILQKEYGIVFNRIIAITNSPVGGFRRYLIKNNKYEDYLRLLTNNFNSEALNHIMCRRLISVDYLGYVYDCDFNLSLGIRIKGYEDKKFWDIDFENFNPEISCAEHCYACVADKGSSCHGVLIKEEDFNAVELVKRYYGKELKGTSDLKTSACCTIEPYPSYIKEILPYIADEIKEKYYGCGSPIPPAIEGLTVLDIGCGTGRDCYILSKLTGERGFIYGIDMTEEQISVAKRYVNYHTERFGYKKPNVLFIHDYIENLDRHFGENMLDLIISNCVINLIEDKERVLKQIYRILKDSGEFYFSDIYADRRLPDNMRKDPLLYGECLGGALYWKDFERIAKRAGFVDPRIVSKRTIEISNEEIKRHVQGVTFYSITYRLWKIEGLEEGCEDYGHVVIYRGGIRESPFKFMLDSNHVFEKDRPERVCGNTALMLLKTRFSSYFEVTGSFKRHFGSFSVSGNLTTHEERNLSYDRYSCC
ncbi:MAG: arsenosugar biosynthesis radical SAM (seleno)protein ArsS [Thermodesulfovibrionales bacterium]